MKGMALGDGVAGVREHKKLPPIRNFRKVLNENSVKVHL